MSIAQFIGNPHIGETQIPIPPCFMTSKIMIKNSNHFKFSFVQRSMSILMRKIVFRVINVIAQKNEG